MLALYSTLSEQTWLYQCVLVMWGVFDSPHSIPLWYSNAGSSFTVSTHTRFTLLLQTNKITQVTGKNLTQMILDTY